MDKVRLLFSTSRHPLSAVIRACTWSSWSHVALIDADGVIEATAPRGVRRIPLAQAIGHSKNSETVELPCRNARGVINAAASQIGKPYDYPAIFGLGLHRDWQDDDRWFCSELVAWSFAQADAALFRADTMRRVTPQHLWMLAPSPPLDLVMAALTEGRLVRPSSCGDANG